ncbi:carbonic anhydrase 6-like [Belonocnema kinseyi]|uniref:carbonic anhydrase 6-like n=1 Tax=Belonocnema kinseyi TaxID=2817044 RepID=UPI00143CE65E|nr:carbonic anhydrase 6-like [Belonocnema kinseyi]
MTDMEMHFYFYKKDLKSFKNAQSQKDGLAGLKVAFSTGLIDFNDHVFDNLVKNLHKVQSPNSTAVIRAIPIFESILNKSQPPFDYYKGSLDYPPCSESVIWIEFQPNYPTNKNLVNAFRKIKLAEEDVSNVRPYQALNGRQPHLVHLQGSHD